MKQDPFKLSYLSGLVSIPPRLVRSDYYYGIIICNGALFIILIKYIGFLLRLYHSIHVVNLN